jgi:hypothetical protein
LLEPDGNLVLADADAKRLRENGIEVGVEEDQRAVREIRHQAKLEHPGHPALENRPRAPEFECVDDRRCVDDKPAIDLDEAAKLHFVGMISGLHADTVIPAGREGLPGRVIRSRSGRKGWRGRRGPVVALCPRRLRTEQNNHRAREEPHPQYHAKPFSWRHTALI